MDKIYTSVNTLMDMFQDRGLSFPRIDAGQIDEFISQQASKLGFELRIGDVRVVYYLANKFKWSELKKFFEDEEDNPPALTILVVMDKISQSNMKQLQALNIEFQVFLLKELQYNLTKHVLVPKHEVLRDPAEIKNVMDMFSLKSKAQLPIILKTDPMARWLNLKSGDLVRITRPSQTSGHYTVYRCCV